MAMPLIIVPLERLGTYQKASKHDRGDWPKIYEALAAELNKPFRETRFRGAEPWSELVVPAPVHGPDDWVVQQRKAGGLFTPALREAIDCRDGLTVMNGLRCALAHGSIAYLDEDGFFAPGAEAKIISMFAVQRQKDAETVRIVSIHQDAFLAFLHRWAQFLIDISAERADVRIDPAEITAIATPSGGGRSPAMAES